MLPRFFNERVIWQSAILLRQKTIFTHVTDYFAQSMWKIVVVYWGLTNGWPSGKCYGSAEVKRKMNIFC